MNDKVDNGGGSVGGSKLYNGRTNLVLDSLSNSYSKLDSILARVSDTLLVYLILSTSYRYYQLLL